MNNIQIASLAFKLAGIFSIIQAIPILRDITEVIALKNSLIYGANGQPFSGNYILTGVVASIALLVLLSSVRLRTCI